MKIRLDRLEDEPFAWRETLSVSVAEIDRDELLEIGEISTRGTLERLDDGVRLAAQLNYDQTLACVRCLEPIVAPVERRFELILLVGAPQPTAGEYDLEVAELDVLYLDEEILDTRPLMMEQIQLNIPMRALCREDCLGLCPVCGGNRNERACTCAEREVDPRWAALERLRGE